MDWRYESWESGEPYNWGGAQRGTHPIDQMDFHVDLGCGAGVKKGRIGIDHFAAPGVNIVMELDSLAVYGLAPAPNRDAEALRAVDGERQLHTPAGRQSLEYPPMISMGLPFDDNSIKSIISHHCLEHIGLGFIRLIDEVYRVLEPDGIFRAITPLFPSRAAVDDPTHVRYFTETTWEFCCGKPGETHWMESFSVPYTSARFEKVHQDVTALAAPGDRWKDDDAREIRVALRANK